MSGDGSPNRIFLAQPNPLTLQVSNPTPLPAGGVLLLLQNPDATELDLSLSPGWQCPAGNTPGAICRYSIGTLPAGASDEVTVTPVLTSLGGPRGLFRVEIAAQDDGSKGADGAPDDNQFAFERSISPVVLSVGEPSGDSTTELGGSVTFEVTANLIPTNEVVIPLSVSRPDEASIDPEMIVFEAGESPQPVLVTVTGLDDFELDEDQVYMVRLGPALSDDPDWRGLDGEDLEFTNEDNETIIAIPTTGDFGTLLLLLLLGWAGIRVLRQ